MKNAFLPIFAAALLASCAGTASQVHWDKLGANGADFSSDNESCAAHATREVPQPRADLLPGGVSVPNNRMEQAPRPWAHPVAERAYMDCMAGRGWRLVQR